MPFSSYVSLNTWQIQPLQLLAHLIDLDKASLNLFLPDLLHQLIRHNLKFGHRIQRENQHLLKPYMPA